MSKQLIALIIILSGIVLLFITGCELLSPIAPTPTLGIGSTRVSEKDGMVLVYVPEGEFLMGAPEIDTKAWDFEKPQHTVWLDAFWIDKTEVTNTLYRKCVKTGACTVPRESKSYTRNSYYGNSDYANYPVILVNWNQARAYCEWTGRRLPSEAEWEKAARGTDGRFYPWGNEGVAGDLLNSADKNTHFDWSDKNIDDGYDDTAPVGSYPKGASPFGVLDMAGNVWEWVNDWFQEDYYQNSPYKNPKGPSSGETRVQRGGSWLDPPSLYRSFFTYERGGTFPVQSIEFGGFRCVASP